MKTRLFLIIFLFESSLTVIVEGNKDEKELLNFIFKGYDSRIRPVKDYNSPLNISFFISLLQLVQVNEKQQTITIRILHGMYWNDYSLNWNAENYGNISQVTVPRGQVYRPDIHLYNSAIDEHHVESDIKTIVMKDGNVSDILPMVVKSTCIMDVTWFPFDEQKCPLEFGSWTESGKFINMVLLPNLTTAGTSRYIDNGEWKLMGAPGVEKAHKYSCCPDPYNVIVYTIHLKRRSFYYFFSLLIPCALIGFLAILGFTLPPESGEKLPLGVTILFSLIVFLSTISESMPANSDAVPLLATYFNCIMVMIALSVVSTIVINLKLGAIDAKGMEGCWTKLFFNWLPWIVRIDSKNFRNSSEEIDKQQWIFVANVVDRMCFIISLVFTTISVIVFLICAF